KNRSPNSVFSARSPAAVPMRLVAYANGARPSAAALAATSSPTHARTRRSRAVGRGATYSSVLRCWKRTGSGGISSRSGLPRIDDDLADRAALGQVGERLTHLVERVHGRHVRPHRPVAEQLVELLVVAS